MPLMYKKILVPVDGSEPSFDAIRHAADLAAITKGTVDLIHVVDVADQVQVYTHFHSAYLPDTYLEDFMTIGNEIMSEALPRLPEEVRGEALVKTGEPRDFLLHFIEEQQYDLVVIGCRGLSALPGLFLGSVSQFLVQNAKCPVLVVK